MPKKSSAAAALFYDPNEYPIGESIAYLMKVAVASIYREADKELREQGLTGVQMLPLLSIAHCKAVTAAEMARLAGTDPGAATRMLDRLEAKGLVRRVRSEQDRRVLRLEVTDAGLEIAKRLPQVLAAVLNRHLTGFSKTEFEQLRTLLTRVITNGEALRDA